jgi:hypothetical protein
MMAFNAFNRLVALVLFLALIAASAVILLVATQAVEPSTLAPSGWFDEQFQKLAYLKGSDETIATVGPAAVIALAGILFVLEMFPPQRSAGSKSIRLRDANGNHITMPTESIAMMADDAAMRVPGVMRSASTVRSDDSGAIIRSDVSLRDDVNVVKTSAALNDQIKSTVQERGGIKVGGLQLQLRVERPNRREEKREGWFRRRHSGEPSPR